MHASFLGVLCCDDDVYGECLGATIVASSLTEGTGGGPVLSKRARDHQKRAKEQKSKRQTKRSERARDIQKIEKREKVYGEQEK